jgi:bile acid:Na+ symporter, BASS family
METQILTNVLLPVVIASLMFGLGLGLSKSDFLYVRNNPRSILPGLFVQLIVLPLFAYGICQAFSLSPTLSIGMMLLAATPGGTTANVLSRLANANVALSVSLTAISSMIGIFFVPTMIWIAFQLFSDQSLSVPFEFSKYLQLVFILLVPVSAGMFVRSKYPAWAIKAEKHFNKFALIAILILLAVGIRKEWPLIRQGVADAGWAIFAFNVGTMVISYGVSTLLRLPPKDRSALTIEMGVHNSSVALGIAMSPTLLNNIEMAVPAAIYIVSMYITAIPFVFLVKNRNS